MRREVTPIPYSGLNRLRICEKSWLTTTGMDSGRPMSLSVHSFGSILVLAALFGAGCDRSEGVSDIKTSWAGSLGAKLKSGLDSISESTLDGPLMTRIVYDSERCMTAPEGGADCREAARQICRARGFISGGAVDTASVNSCRPRSFAELHSGDGLSCQTKYQVTAALCW